MELSEAIKGRRSVRRFRPDPVQRDVIERILELAQWAPSAMNRQDWRFIVVEGEKSVNGCLLLHHAGSKDMALPHAYPRCANERGKTASGGPESRRHSNSMLPR